MFKTVQKIPSHRGFRCAIAIVAVIVLALIVNICHEASLQKEQEHFLAMLAEEQGNYNEGRIVLSSTNRWEAQAVADTVGGTLRITDNGKFAVVQLPEHVTLEQVASNDECRKYLRKIQLDYNGFAVTQEDVSEQDLVISSYPVEDTMYAQQGYLGYLNIGDTWHTTRGANSNGEKVTVAIIDTGIDTDHPEFYDESGNSIISVNSYNASTDKTVSQNDVGVIEDTIGHGTAVAGVLAAQMNGQGIVGISPDVELLVIKCEADQYGTFSSSSDIVFAIYYAIEFDVDVINMSLGGTYDEAMEQALQLAVDSDIICVAAAGNDATDFDHFPAAFETVIGVGALEDNSWEIASYSNYGINSDIMAPGTALTTAVGGGYVYQTGTSISAPMVSAAAALYISQNKYVSLEKLQRDLLAAGKDLGDPGEDAIYGFGALDIYSFVLADKGTITYDYCTEDIDPTTQVFVRQHTIQTVPEPERDHVIFDGWYLDKAYTKAFDYESWYTTVFVEDLTLYAKWVNEDDEDASVYNYRTLEDGTIEIVSYKGKRRYLTIPDEIDGKIVSNIGNYAFSGNSRLRGVSFPTGLVGIGEGAFQFVRRLTEIEFRGNRLEQIGKAAFNSCQSLRVLDLPDSVITIGASAFEFCSALKTVQITQNSKLEQIGNKAFSYTAISSFYIPQYITAAGFDGSVLAGCQNMRSVTVHPDSKAFFVETGALYTLDYSKIVYYPAALTGAYQVADQVRTIGCYAFSYSRVSALDLNAVVWIEGSAFEKTAQLSKVNIPDTVMEMGGYAFAGSSISQVVLSENLSTLSKGVFSNTNLIEIHIPAEVKVVESAAFKGCVRLERLTFAEDSKLMQIIGSSQEGGAFEQCKKLGNFKLPNSIQYIGVQAFQECQSITELEIPANVSEIGVQAFRYCTSLATVDFADGCVLSSVPAYCFEYCSNLQTVSFSDNILTLGKRAFSRTSKLRVLNFGQNSRLHTVGDSCFQYCESLQEMQLPNTVTMIGQFAYVFSGLKQVEISANLTSIGHAAFGACYNLTTLVVDADNSVYEAVDNVLFDENINTVYCVPAARAGSYTVPDTVKTVAPYAFYYDRHLTHVILPDGLEDIQMNAFYSCSGLQEIHIPANVQNIGRQAFVNCYSMKTVTFGEDSRLKRLGIYTFVNCGMTEITIPATVEEIAQYAFYCCSSLKKITFEENSKLSYIAAYVLKGTNVERVVFEAGSALTNIQAHAFDGAYSLKYVDFGNAQITNIDNYAFYNCQDLEEIDVPDTVEYIGRYAFYNCTKLDRIDLSEAVEFIGQCAFMGTNKIRVFFEADDLAAYAQTGWDKGIAGYFLGAADYVVAGEWEYVVRHDGTVALAKYHGSETELVLDTIDGYVISRVGTSCFYDNDNLKKVTLGSDITHIGNYAFYDCDGLLELDLTAAVEEIGQYAFADTAIEVRIPENAALKLIDAYAFANNSTDCIVLPDNVVYIGECAFFGSDLTDLTISQASMLQSIGAQAFVGSKIEEIYLPANLETVGVEAFKEVASLRVLEIADGASALKISNSAFEGCAIAEVNIPARVNYIGEYAFGSCPNLQNIHVDGQNHAYTSLDGVLCDSTQTTLIQYPCGRNGAYQIPVQIKVLTYASFKNAKELTAVTFAEGCTVRTIGWQTFSGCEKLQSIEIPDGVVSIDFYAFENCNALAQVIIEENSQMTGVYEGAFYNCSALSSIMLPDSIVEIGDYAFYNCTSLKTVPLRSTAQVKGIYDYAFYGCSGITWIPELANVTEIGAYAFAYTDVTEYTIPVSLKKVEMTAFEGCENMTAIHCDEDHPEFVEIDDAVYDRGAFGADDLEALVAWPYGRDWVIGAGKVTLTGNDTAALRGTIKLPVKIADSVTAIADEAFYGCGGLVCIVIPEGVTTIGERAFYGCVNLEYISISNSVTTIGDDALDKCPLLTSVGPIDGGHDIEFGWKETIPEYAFSDCSSLTSITIPENIVSIGDDAFSWCRGVTEIHFNAVALADLKYCNDVFHCVGDETDGVAVTIGAQVTRIPVNLFNPHESGCNLKSVVFEPGSVCTEIGGSAFGHCSSLKQIMIPASVTKIAGGAFGDCGKLVLMLNGAELVNASDDWYGDAVLLTNIRSWGGYFGDFSYYITNNDEVIVSAYSGTDTHVVVPEKIHSMPVIEIAGHTFEGNTRIISASIPDTVATIGDDAFRDCVSLTTVEDFDKLKTIKKSAFEGCTALMRVDLAGELTEIGGYAFAGCTRLEEAILPDTVQTIGGCAFEGCSALARVSIPANLAEIGRYVFAECVQLQEIAYNATALGDLEEYNHIFDRAGANGDGIKVIVGVNVTRIPANFFNPYSGGLTPNITNVEFATGSVCKVIGKKAFYGCTNLETIEIPKSVTNINDYAFYGCTNVREFYFNAEKMESLPARLYPFGNMGAAGDGILLTIGKDVVELPAYFMAAYANDYPANVSTLVFEENSACTKIGREAFQYCISMKSAHLPESLITIEENAFCYCENLSYVFIPASVQQINRLAFYDCIALQVVQIESEQIVSEMTTSGDSCGCVGKFAKSIIIPQEITDIGSYIKNYYTTLETIEIAGKTYIVYSDHAHIWEIQSTVDWVECQQDGIVSSKCETCGMDKQVVTAAHDYAETILQAPTCFVDGSACRECSRCGDKVEYALMATGQHSLSSWYTEHAATANDPGTSRRDCKYCEFYEQGAFETIASGSCGVATEWVLKGTGELWIYGTGETLDWGIYEDTPWSSVRGKITSVNIADSVQYVGNAAFYNCVNLQSVHFGNQITVISNNMFANCRKLSNIEIPEGVTTIGGYAFDTCKSLSSIEIPQNVVTIGGGAFEDCTGLTSISIPKNVKSLGGSAFNGCTNLTNIYIEAEALEDIQREDNRIFYRVGSATDGVTVTIGKNVTRIPAYLFATGTNVSDPSTVAPKIKRVVFETGSKCEEIGHNAFSRCVWLESIELPDSLTTIAERVFYNCTGINGVQLPENLMTIGNSAFYNCTGLDSIQLPNNLETIGDSAFYGCTGLTQIAVPEKVTKIGASAFGNCSSLLMIQVDGNNIAFCANDGVLFSKDGKKLILYPAGRAGAYTVPAGVTSIESGAFYGCSNLTGITLPEGLESIGSSAFYGCTGLTKVAIPATVTKMGQSVFQNCGALTSAGPSGSGCAIEYGWQTMLPTYAFFNCGSLTELIIAPSITEIGEYACSNCVGLTQLTIPANVTTIGDSAFSGCRKLEVIYYNAINVESLRSGNWVFASSGKGGNGITLYIGADVKRIPSYLFSPYRNTAYGHNIVSVVFAEGSKCEEIGYSAFEYSNTIKSVVFSADAPKIRSSAFGSVTATMYYPGDNATWTESVMQNYGGTLTWQKTCGNSHTPGAAADCENDQICTVCGEVLTEKLDHDLVDVAGKDATCTEPGYTAHKDCSRCDYIEGKTEIPAGHTLTQVEGKAPTCTEAGYEAFEFCTVCDYTTYAEVTAKGHTPSAAVKENETAGSYESVIYCADCGTELNRETIVTHTHTLIMVEAKAPTYAMAGNITYYYCECGKYFSDAEGANEIAEGSWVIAALAVDKDTNLAIKPTSTGTYATLMLGAELKMSFNVSVKNTTAYDRIFLQITKLGKTTDVEIYSSSSSNHQFRYTIAAPEMTVEMTVVVCGEKDGQIYVGDLVTFTYKDIVIDKMDAFYNGTNEKNKVYGCALLANLLKYGEEAQKRFNINTDNLATSGLSETYLALINNATPALDTWTAPSSATYYLGSYSPMLQEQIKIAFTFAVPEYSSLEGYEVRIVQTKSKDGTVVEHSFGADVLKSTRSTRIRCDFAIAGAEGRDQLAITLYKDGVAVSETVVTNLSALAQGKQSAALNPLLYAMMNYCDAAKAFFG